MHKFAVHDCPVDIHAIGYIDKCAYGHRNGLSAADRDPRRASFANAVGDPHGDGIAGTDKAARDRDG